MDSSDQIQIRIFEIHNLSVSLGKDLKNVFLTSGFPNKTVWIFNGTYVDGALLWAISYISFRVCHLFTFVGCFLTLTCHVFCTYVVSAYVRLFSKFKKKRNNSPANCVRCILLEKRLCFKPKYAHFVHSYVSLCRFSFLSSPRESVCCFFFYFPHHEEHEDMPLSW